MRSRFVFLAVDLGERREQTLRPSTANFQSCFRGGEAADLPSCGSVVLEHAGGERFEGGDPEVPLGIVDGLAEAVVGVAHDPVGPIADELTGGAEAVAEAGLEYPVAGPTLSLRDEAGLL
jgi:hypothetical protein